ncbi:response regulator transcription factor [Ornithinimicrobium faecis]|uniref:Response regulator transcription factor n=2 Tax=Ornithinimicrobium faecis TaxID=2934158 RepID=A0ABY4YT77_9MICO|nr:response regulator transcription factor [Ornithinimicrobium sp. HY1793]USQ79787.1 response regulator transcription factor [Ornithinimicrobium sp. HY1793]
MSDLNLSFQVERHPETVALAAGHRPRSVIVALGLAEGPMEQFIRDLTSSAGPQHTVLALVRDLSEEQESTLLEVGARDALNLPSTAGRLRARLALAMRGFPLPTSDVAEVVRRGCLAIHLGRREVRVHNEEVGLTKTEFDLLASLAQRPRNVLSRQELTSAVMGHDHMGARALESHLSRLRRKIELAGGPRLVEPVRGVGYRLGVS